FWNCSPVQAPSAAHNSATAATTRKPRQRAVRPREAAARELKWLVLVIYGTIPSPCIARCVDVPGSTLDCNMRALPGNKPLGLACGTHNALAVQSLQETPDTPPRHHRGHLWHDRDARARTVVLPGLGRAGHG